MNWFKNVLIEDREIENESLELADKGSLYFLGPNLTLSHCTVILKVPARNLLIGKVRFIDCTFEVRRELKNHDWSCAFLKNCRFTGRLSGCDFGHRLPYSTPGREHGGIEACDFSAARLDGCRVHGCDPRTVQFPPWPCFTLLKPLEHASELRSVQWPGPRGSIIADTLDKQPTSTQAITKYAPAYAKMVGTTPEALKAVIEPLDFVVY